MRAKDLILIKKEYLKEYNYQESYLCTVAESVGLREEFVEYLMENLEGTTMSRDSENIRRARWSSEDGEGRIAWLDKHIERLEQLEEIRW